MFSGDQSGRIYTDSSPISDRDLPRKSNHKDCRKWCKGRIGKSHKFIWRDLFEVMHIRKEPASANIRWRIQVCEVCGRHRKLEKLIT